MRTRSGRSAWERRLTTTFALFAATAAVALLIGPAQAAPPECETGATGYFTIDEIGPATAGDDFTVIVRAFDCSDAPLTTYAGSAELSGGSEAPDGTDPNYGAPLVFAGGEATTQVTLFARESGVQLTASDGDTGDMVDGESNAFNVGPGSLASFTIDTVANQTAGTPFTVTAHAFDAYGNDKTDYDGGVLTGTAGTSPGGFAPVYDTDIDWVDGEGSADVTLYNREGGVTVTLTDGPISETSNAFDVAAGPLAEFTIAQIGLELGPPTHYVVEATTPFNISATAFDPYGNVKTNYDGTGAILSGTLEGSPTYGALSWLDGVGTGSVTATVHSVDREVTVTDGLITETSNKFDVVAELCTDATKCEGSTTNGSKKVELLTPLGTGTASIGFFVPQTNTFNCLLRNGTTTTITVAGAVALVDPPPGYTVNNPLTLTMTLSKQAAPGTGVVNFIICLSKDRGQTYNQVVDCGKKFKKSDIPCITRRSRTGVGELVITMLITSEDPWGGTGLE